MVELLRKSILFRDPEEMVKEGGVTPRGLHNHNVGVDGNGVEINEGSPPDPP